MKEYNWVSVYSSLIEKVAFDEELGELLVRFKNGREYYYVLFPKKLYEEFLDSSSKVNFFNEKIKEFYGYGRNS